MIYIKKWPDLRSSSIMIGEGDKRIKVKVAEIIIVQRPVELIDDSFVY